MILALRNEQWRSTGFERRNYVIEDKVIPRYVPSELGIQRLDCGLFSGRGSRKPELSVTENHLAIERSCCRLLLGVDAVTDGTTLHNNDRVVTILPRDRRREAKQVSSLCLARDGLKANGGQVMAFVDDDMAVFGDHIGHDAFPHKALHESNIDVSSGFPLSAMDDANLLRRNIKKDSQASDPLIEKLPTMDKDEGVSAARGDQFGGHDGLSKSRRCGEHPCLVSKKHPRGTATCFGNSSAQEIMRGLPKVGRRMACAA